MLMWEVGLLLYKAAVLPPTNQKKESFTVRMMFNLKN